MEQQKSGSPILFVLQQIKQRGYIPQKHLAICVQVLNHSFSNLFKHPPIPASLAEECMHELNNISRVNPAFYSFFQETMFDLHDWGTTDDELSKTRSDNLLLRFFSQESPSSLKRKNTLLSKLSKMERFPEKLVLISGTLYTLMNHYEYNQQFNEDPGLRILENTGAILTKLCTAHSKITAQARKRLQFCARIIQKHAPQFAIGLWNTRFQIQKPIFHHPSKIKEPLVVFKRTFPYPQKIHF